MYTPYYRTPRLYLSGYLPNGQPLPPQSMMDDIVGDYKDKTVTLEDFPFFGNNVKMASVHPCKHASVMKTLLDRADAALRIRRDKLRAGRAVGGDPGMKGGLVVGGLGAAALDVRAAPEAADKDEWEEVQGVDADEHEVAIRVDQYLVVFLKVSRPPLARRLRALHVLTACPAVHGQRHARHRARLHDGRLRRTPARLLGLVVLCTVAGVRGVVCLECVSRTWIRHGRCRAWNKIGSASCAR